MRREPDDRREPGRMARAAGRGGGPAPLCRDDPRALALGRDRLCRHHRCRDPLRGHRHRRPTRRAPTCWSPRSPARTRSSRSLPLIFESVDPTRDVETASQFVTNLDVATRVEEEPGSTDSARDLLSKVKADPVAQSNIVAVTATGDSPGGGAGPRQRASPRPRSRTAPSRSTTRSSASCPALEAQLESRQRGRRAQAAPRSAQLEALRAAPDPSLRLETAADLPTAQASPRPVLSDRRRAARRGWSWGSPAPSPRRPSTRGCAARSSFGASTGFRSSPASRREPKRRATPRSAPPGLSAAGAEAYRTLRATLEASRANGTGSRRDPGHRPRRPRRARARPPSTSPPRWRSPGSRVILIEADLRRPGARRGARRRARPGRGRQRPDRERQARGRSHHATATGRTCRLLLADYEGGWIAELFSIPAARELIEDARKLADYVIIDSPPAERGRRRPPPRPRADDVLIVVRLGETRLERISQLGELLAENGVRPVGFAVVGVPRPPRGESRYYTNEAVDTPEPRRGRSSARPRRRRRPDRGPDPRSRNQADL